MFTSSWTLNVKQVKMLIIVFLLYFYIISLFNIFNFYKELWVFLHIFNTQHFKYEDIFYPIIFNMMNDIIIINLLVLHTQNTQIYYFEHNIYIIITLTFILCVTTLNLHFKYATFVLLHLKPFRFKNIFFEIEVLKEKYGSSKFFFKKRKQKGKNLTRLVARGFC